MSVLLVNAGMAQTRVTGTVTLPLEDGSPIPYAVVLLKGSKGWEQTLMLTGNIPSAIVPANAVLIFSYRRLQDTGDTCSRKHSHQCRAGNRCSRSR